MLVDDAPTRAARARPPPGSSAAWGSRPARRRPPCGRTGCWRRRRCPPTTTPRRWASTIASPNGVPLIDRGQLELVAAGHEDAGRLVELGRPASGSWASLAALGPHRRPPRRRRACGTGRRTPRRPRGRARRRSGSPRSGRRAPPLAATNSVRIVALAQLVLGAADDHEGSGWHDREASGCQSERRAAVTTPRRDPARQGRAGRRRPTPSGRSTERGRAATPSAGGAWLAGQGVRPRPRAGLVGAPGAGDLGGARRAAAGWDVEPDVSTRRCTPPGRRPPSTCSARRPTRRHGARRRRPQPDHGLRSRSCSTTATATPRPATEMATGGFPTGAVAVVRVRRRLGRPRRWRLAPGWWPSTSAATADPTAQTGGAGVTMPASASAASISSREMPSRYMIASRYGTLTEVSAASRTTGLAL